MILLVLSNENLRTLKVAIRQQLPRIGSSHISEAIARALSFKDHSTALFHIQELITPEARAFTTMRLWRGWPTLAMPDGTSEIRPDLVLALGLPIFPASLDGDRVTWSEPDAVLVRLD